MVSVEIDTSGETPIPQNPVDRFSLTEAGVVNGFFDVASDGRLVMAQRVSDDSVDGSTEAATPTIVVIENWFVEFEERR